MLHTFTIADERFVDYKITESVKVSLVVNVIGTKRNLHH